MRISKGAKIILNCEVIWYVTCHMFNGEVTWRHLRDCLISGIDPLARNSEFGIFLGNWIRNWIKSRTSIAPGPNWIFRLVTWLSANVDQLFWGTKWSYPLFTVGIFVNWTTEKRVDCSYHFRFCSHPFLCKIRLKTHHHGQI